MSDQPAVQIRCPSGLEAVLGPDALVFPQPLSLARLRDGRTDPKKSAPVNGKAPGIVIALIIILICLTVAAAAFVIAPRLTVGRVVFDATPDTPKSFGYRMSWLAIKSTDTHAVAAALALTGLEAANWNTGIGAIYDRDLSDSYVFVSPPVKGWTFIAGVPLPHPVGGPSPTS